MNGAVSLDEAPPQDPPPLLSRHADRRPAQQEDADRQHEDPDEEVERHAMDPDSALKKTTVSEIVATVCGDASG
jgi:hypothetical protein